MDLNNPFFSHQEGLLTSCSPSSKFAEVITDKCTISIYVLDNSGSMNCMDGKVFVDGISQGKRSRWAETTNRLIKIAQYNIDRGQNAVYYLLNPITSGVWIPGRDMVAIPCITNNISSLMPLCDICNVRGGTPLAKITKYITHELLVRNNHPNVNSYDPICYNLLTDGFPDDSTGFTSSLKQMIHPDPNTTLSVFITINLTTRDQSIIDYYGTLNHQLGTEICGLDVLDEWGGEACEIEKLNPFLCYAERFHIARMAGCYNKLWDHISEYALNPQHIHGFFNEIFHGIKLPQYSDATKKEEYREILTRAVQNYGKVQSCQGKYLEVVNTKLAIFRIFGSDRKACCFIM